MLASYVLSRTLVPTLAKYWLQLHEGHAGPLFFFQAEDGIRDFHVTGVQTCALPILRRALAKSGRSRAWIAGQLLPIASLAELFAARIEISSQHDSQSLLRTERHAELLDRWAGLESTRARVAAEVARQREIAAELA